MPRSLACERSRLRAEYMPPLQVFRNEACLGRINLRRFEINRQAREKAKAPAY